MKLAVLVLAFSATVAKGQDFDIMHAPVDSAAVELHLQRASDINDASVWLGLIGGVFTIAAAQQASPSNNLGALAVGFGSFTIVGIQGLKHRSHRQSELARALLHQ